MPCRLRNRQNSSTGGAPQQTAARSSFPSSSVIVTNDHCIVLGKKTIEKPIHPELRQHMAEICSDNVCSCFLWHEDRESKRKESPGVLHSSQLTKRKDWHLQAGGSLITISSSPLQVWTGAARWKKHTWVSFPRRNCREEFLLQSLLFGGWGIPQTLC